MPTTEPKPPEQNDVYDACRSKSGLCPVYDQCLAQVLNLQATHCEYLNRRKQTMPAEQFIEIWNSSETIDAAVETIGTLKHAAIQRAARLRKKGHHLQAFKRTRKPFATQDEFITSWNASSSTAEVAEMLDITKNAVGKRAARLRKKGHHLKDHKK